jgi:hypothetical protein
MPHEIAAEEIETMAQQMKTFPVRFGELGLATGSNPIIGSDQRKLLASSEADFRLRENSPAVDGGATYFIPFSLYGTVGEWHFTENRARPTQVVDYHWYMSEAHFFRMLYEQIPSFDLNLNRATLEDYTASPSEDWCNGAVRFDGTRYGAYPDALLRQDLRIKFRGNKTPPVPKEPWTVVQEEGIQYAIYPAAARKTLRIGTENLLLEAILKVEKDHTGGAILGKHDGQSGYRLAVDDQGRAVFQIASRGEETDLATRDPINDGAWHHVLAEMDRATGRMTVYLDGKQSAERKSPLVADASLENRSDFLVGSRDGTRDFFVGILDFARVCRGTLADAQTSIEELYEWQTNGPFKYDFCGNAPIGGRDAGAIELIKNK